MELIVFAEFWITQMGFKYDEKDVIWAVLEARGGICHSVDIWSGGKFQ